MIDGFTSGRWGALIGLVFVLAACGPVAREPGSTLLDSKGPLVAAIDAQVRASMERHRTPGVTVALTTPEGLVGVWTLGYADLKLRTPVTEETLFQIGSVSKSFTALALMQLWDEGRLDLEAPVTDYLPWWEVQSDFEPIRVEHLLTHTAGIPGNRDDIFSSPYMAWALREQRTAWPPGSRFHYSNVGYQSLHALLEAVSGETYADLIERRLFDPLEMRASRAAITLESRTRQAVGYIPPFDDRPIHHSRALVEAPHHEYRIGDGAIQSTASDLAAYVRLWLNRGAGPEGRIVSEEAFERFSTPHPGSLDEDGSNGYGLGVFVQQSDGRLILRHSGGMVGFACQVAADMTDRVGVVVMINGPGDSRAIADYALAAWRAATLGEPVPEAPAPADRTQVDNVVDYAGSFASDDMADELRFEAEDDRLWLVRMGERLPLERRGEDRFYTPDPGFDRYMLEFGRDDDGQVVEVMYGPRWYVSERYEGPRTFESPESWTSYIGRYRNFSPWFPYLEVIARKGSLLAITGPGGESSTGETLLVALGDGVFRAGEDLTPEIVHFENVVDGRALRAVWTGHPFFRSAD